MPGAPARNNLTPEAMDAGDRVHVYRQMIIHLLDLLDSILLLGTTPWTQYQQDIIANYTTAFQNVLNRLCDLWPMIN
uniref:Uncharacterized protein n=1 Tax=Caenorhabditis tropicalis TaxID=1561998 RepID=A0A1I7UF08_9PELO